MNALDIIVPETFWNHEDDSCDCVFQRIGMWKNPYVGETLEVRWCCIWAELFKMFPDKVRTTKAYLVDDESWDTSVLEWNGESDMPRSIWYRQLARKHGITVAQAREQYAHLDPPKGIPRAAVEATEGPSMLQAILAQLVNLNRRVKEMEDERGS